MARGCLLSSPTRGDIYCALHCKEHPPAALVVINGSNLPLRMLFIHQSTPTEDAPFIEQAASRLISCSQESCLWQHHTVLKLQAAAAFIIPVCLAYSKIPPASTTGPACIAKHLTETGLYDSKPTQSAQPQYNACIGTARTSSQLCQHADPKCTTVKYLLPPCHRSLS